MSTPILGKPRVAARVMGQWARHNGGTDRFVYAAEDYWRLGWSMGIRPEVAYAQAGHESGYGRFGRALDASHNQYCGLKIPDPHTWFWLTGTPYDDAEPEIHQRFPNQTVGIRAHLEHLGLYAGHPGMPLAYEKLSFWEWTGDTVDPRHFPWIHGAAPAVEDLGGEVPSDDDPDWAPSPTYGPTIARKVQEILDTTV